MQELGKFAFEINTIPNEIEKYKTYSQDNIFQFLSFSLDILLKNLGRKKFCIKFNLSKEFDSKVLHLVIKQKDKNDLIPE